MIKTKIEAITSDEDQRNDLWVAVLENKSDSLLDDPQEILNRSSYACAQEDLFLFLKEQPSVKLTECLERFSAVEKTIMFMIMLGFSSNQISEYKIISQVRLEQMIRTIAAHPIWEKYFEQGEAER